jgi:membrane fusion protein (multidrug efflux system)
MGAGTICLALAATLAGCTSQAARTAAAAGPPPPLVQVLEVHAQDLPIYAEYPAQTYARQLVEVRGRVDGYVEQWLFKPGDHVNAGQALYVLDTRPFRAQVQQAEGNVRQAEADLTFAQNQPSLLQAEANLAAAKANLIKAQQDYDRFKPLVEQDAAARQELDAATAALDAAKSNVRALQEAVNNARLSTKTQIQSSQGKLLTQQGILTTANLNLQYATIQAPISGLIGDTQVPVGGLVTANATTPLTTIVPLDPMWVRFQLSESQYLTYRKMRGTGAPAGPSLDLLLADGSKFPSPGRIENTLNQVDAKTGTLQVQARFPNPQNILLPGQFGRVRFVSETMPNALAVPQRAVQQNQSNYSVLTVGAGEKVEVRAVKPGARTGDDWIIEQGLKPGDRVIVEGLLAARPGAPVRTAPYHGSTKPESATGNE